MSSKQYTMLLIVIVVLGGAWLFVGGRKNTATPPQPTPRPSVKVEPIVETPTTSDAATTYPTPSPTTYGVPPMQTADTYVPVRPKKGEPNPELARVAAQLRADPKYKEFGTADAQKLAATLVATVESQGAAAQLMQSIEQCVTAPPEQLSAQMQANCLIGAEELVRKFPALKEAYLSKILGKASPAAKSLAKPADAQN